MSDLDREQGEPRRYYGKYAGIVTDNGPPPDGAHRGHIKVRVPGILEESPGGGENRAMEVLAAPAFLPGFFFIPENDARVWVEFVAGDIDFPIWTGVWYPEGAVPATASGDMPKEQQKVIRTASGQVIVLDDADGNEKTVIKDEENGNTITLDRSGITIEVTGSNGTITLKQGQSTVTLKSDSVEIAQGPRQKLQMRAEGTTLTSSAGSSQGVVLAPILDWLRDHKHTAAPAGTTPVSPDDQTQLRLLRNTMISGS